MTRPPLDAGSRPRGRPVYRRTDRDPVAEGRHRLHRRLFGQSSEIRALQPVSHPRSLALSLTRSPPARPQTVSLRTTFANRVAAKAGRTSVRVQAAVDAKWLPGAKSPAHLDGKAPGDFGFDPLGLGSDPERLKWYSEAEKMNGRWAMAACAGILFTDVLGKGKWFEAGAGEYWMPNNALIALEALIMGFLELKRYQGWKDSGVSGFVNAFPFDPAGMASADMAVKEVKNGRLAMVAFIGFATAALVTREGPVEALTTHLSNPFENNVIGMVAKMPQTLGQ